MSVGRNPALLLNGYKVMDKRAVAQCFSRAAPRYDQFAHLQRRVADRMLACVAPLSLPSAPVIADLGTGTGYCLPALADQYAPSALYGLDLSEAMLARAKARVPEVETVVADLEQPPFKPNSIDLAVSSLAVQWLDAPEPFIQRMATVLAPGGHLVLATLGPETLYELRQAWLGVDQNTHVNRFHPATDWLDAIESSSLNLTLWRQDQLEVRYDTPLDLLRELKAIGANHVDRSVAPSNGGVRRMLQIYEAFRCPDQRYPATWDVFYLVVSKA